MSKRCAAIERKREALESALRIVTAPYSRQQKDDALALIAADGLKPSGKPGMWRADSSDGVTVYRCSALFCPCPSRKPCRHMCAVAMRETYEAFEAGDAICVDNLAAVGHALIAYAEANGGAA